MPRNEEGEFELVLGNRQLLSVFFVIVILMGVCFAAGYIFGRNSASASDVARAKKGAESAIVIDPTSEGKGGAQRSSLAPGQVEVRGGSPVAAARPPAKLAPAGGTAERAAAPPPEAAKPVTAPVKPAAAPPRPASEAGSGLVQPGPGQTYLQVAAVRRPDANTLVSNLKKKEFGAGVAAGPNETLFRVVVGPLKDSAEVNRERARLKELGFDPIVKRF
jgi:hypothetical protein